VAEALTGQVPVADIVKLEVHGVNVGKDIWQSIQRYLYMGSPEMVSVQRGSVGYEYVCSGILYGYAAHRLFEQRAYDLVVSNEISYLDWGLFCQYAVRRGIRALHQAHAFRGLQCLNLHLLEEPEDVVELYHSPSERETRALFADAGRTREMTGKGRALLPRAMKPGVDRDEDLLAEERGKWLRPGRKTVVVFTHQCWDSSLTFGDMVYATFELWLEATFRVAARNSDVDWLFKIHPEERKPWLNDQFNTTVLLEDFLGKEPSGHLRIMPAECPLRTVDLAAHIHAGVTAVGTVAFELPALGVPCVVACRKAHGAQPFVIAARSPEQYERILSGVSDLRKPAPEHQELALAYAGMALDESRFLDVSALLAEQDSSDEGLDRRRLRKWLNQPRHRELIRRVVTPNP